MRSRPKPYIYAVVGDELMYWTGLGFVPNRKSRKLFRTSADAEEPLRRMMLDNIKAKVGRES